MAVTAQLLVALMSALLFCASCASLPKVKEVVDETQPEQDFIRIVTASGVLTPEQSRRILERLKKGTKPTDLLERQIGVIESISGSPLIKGNKVTLLVDGPATYSAMVTAVQNARDHINLETFTFEDGEMGQKLADLLIQKQAEGVQVNLIYDSVGSIGTSNAFFARLRDAGVQVLEFNPINPLLAHGWWRITHRDHRKILVADGKVAITGGVNISEVYSSGSFGSDEVQIPWRDTDVQIEGPGVAEFQKLFLDTWQRQKGPKLSELNFFPEIREVGSDLIQVVGNTPGEMNRVTFIMYVSAITFAENSVLLTNAYFVPDEQMIQALTDAAKRGVDVKMILPKTSDSSTALYAGQYYYSDLLQAGVRIYQLRNAVLHAKTAIIDGVWSTVGSTNLDFWSFSENDEVNAIVLSTRFAADMEKMFAEDLSESDRIQLEEWKERPLWHRIREWFAHLFSRSL